MFEITNSNTNQRFLNFPRFSEFTENSTAIFEELSIVATVPTPVTNETLMASDSFYAPLTLDASTLPLKPEEISYNKVVGSNGYTELTLVLENNDVQIYSFGIWGRRFETDGLEPALPSAAAGYGFNLLFMMPIIVCWFVKE